MFLNTISYHLYLSYATGWASSSLRDRQSQPFDRVDRPSSGEDLQGGVLHLNSWVLDSL